MALPQGLICFWHGINSKTLSVSYPRIIFIWNILIYIRSSTRRKWDFADPFDKLWLILLPPEYNFVNDITKLAHTKVVILIIAERSGLLLWAPNGKIMAITRAHVRDTTNQVDVNWKSSIIMEFVSQRNWLFCGYKLYIDFFLFFWAYVDVSIRMYMV